MSQINTYITVPPYVMEWANAHFGNPVKLPYNSVEDRMLRTFMSQWPSEVDSIKDKTDNLALALPSSKAKDPRTYSYLPPKAKAALSECLETLFLHNMWSELIHLQGHNCSLKSLLLGWLEVHGISEDHEEAIRQRFYRLRNKYAKNDIKLHHNRTEHEATSEQVRNILNS